MPRTRGVSKNRKFLDKDECAFCHEKGHWEKDYPKIKEKTKKKKDEANMVEVEDEEFFYALTASSNVDYVKELGARHRLYPSHDFSKALVFKLQS